MTFQEPASTVSANKPKSRSKASSEELVTVNAELQNKITEMAGMQDDMKNLLDNIRVGTIFLDTHLVIRRFTRDATRVYRLQGTDVGRPLADIRSELGTDDLLADAKTVLASLVPLEREIERRPVLLDHPDRAPQQVSLTARRIADQGGHAELVLLVIEPGA